MVTGRPGRWELLGETSDPLPGDPVEVASAARGYARTAVQIGEQVGRLRRVGAGTNRLVGEFQPALEGSADRLAVELGQAQGRFETVAEQLGRWAPVLEAGREETGRLLRQAEDAQHDIEHHQPPDTPVDPADHHARVAEKKRAGALSDAQGELGRVRRRYEQVMYAGLPDGVDAVAAAVAARIEEASRDTLADEGWGGFTTAVAGSVFAVGAGVTARSGPAGGPGFTGGVELVEGKGSPEGGDAGAEQVPEFGLGGEGGEGAAGGEGGGARGGGAGGDDEVPLGDLVGILQKAEEARLGPDTGVAADVDKARLGAVEARLDQEQGAFHHVPSRISFGHGARHLAGSGLSRTSVESAIADEVTRIADRSSITGSFFGRIYIGGRIVEYRAHTFEDGRINVGTYYFAK